MVPIKLYIILRSNIQNVKRELNCIFKTKTKDTVYKVKKFVTDFQIRSGKATEVTH